MKGEGKMIKKEIKNGDLVQTERGWGEVTAVQYDDGGDVFAIEIFYGDGRPGRKLSGLEWPGWGTALVEEIEKCG